MQFIKITKAKIMVRKDIQLVRQIKDSTEVVLQKEENVEKVLPQIAGQFEPKR